MSYEIIKNPHAAPSGIYPNEKLLREFLSYDVLFPELCVLYEAKTLSKETREVVSGYFSIDSISTIHWSRQYELPWSIEASEIKNTDVILDAGCGYSSFKFALAKRCKKVIGIDVDLKALGIARRMCSELDIDNIEFFKTDIANYETDLKFDKIYCLSVLEHDPSEENKYSCIRNMMDLLKPGGELILTMDVVYDRLIEGFYIDENVSKNILQMLNMSHEDVFHFKKIRTSTFFDKNGASTKIYVVCLVYTKPKL